METLSYEKVIKASKQKIWDVIWGNYGEWTQFFSPNSSIKSDWKVNGKTYFLDSKGNGLVSTIDSLEEPNSVVFKHLGLLQDSIEDTQSKEVIEWNGCYEKYILIDFDGETKLHAEVQVEKDHREHMNNAFNKGLEIIKQLSEKI